VGEPASSRIDFSVTVRLEGEMRTAAPTLRGDVGIEFVWLTEVEHDITGFLNEMKINELLAVAHPTAG
jgi:hypothetical protein